MIGVIVPVHNEEQRLEECIESLLAAAFHQDLDREEVRILIVLDDCTDTSMDIAQAYDVWTLSCTHRNVGKTRAQGAEHLLAADARWLAFTDADSVVPDSWLVEQIRFNADAVCGLVKVNDWSEHSEECASAITPITAPLRAIGISMGPTSASLLRRIARRADSRPCPPTKTCNWSPTWNAAARASCGRPATRSPPALASIAGAGKALATT